jgi:hypothetical protein
MPINLATQKAEIRRTVVRMPARANSLVRPYLEKSSFTKIGLMEWLR